MSKSTIAIAALFDENLGPNLSEGEDPRVLLKEADVILGVDVMSEREFLVFGREFLGKVVESGEQPASVLRVELDQETDELERLIALVGVVKGHHDYEG